MDDIIVNAKNKYATFNGKEFRDGQYEAIKFALDSEKKIVALCLPTGAGKSLIGACIAGASGGGTYLVHSRALQVQLQGDFGEVPILWGRGNYKCQRNTGVTCAECTHSRISPCEFKANKCEYVVAKRAALQSPVRVLNYEYWITEANYVGMFGHSDVVIVDEADALEQTMAKFIGLEFSGGLMKRLGISKPKYVTTSSDKSIEEWQRWAEYALGRVKKLSEELGRQIDPEDPDADILRRMETLSGLVRRLTTFIESVDESWIFEEREYDGRKSISFKPTWITRELAEKFVWGHGEKFVLMSATFPPLPVLAQILGVKMGDIEYKQFRSNFPVENRPVVLRPVANLVYKEMEAELPKLIEGIKEVLAKHPGEKGLIHTVSYKVARAVLDIGDPRLVTHEGADKIMAIEEFRDSDEPLVMVSPSSERGISLEDDQCRFIIWAKCPFLSLADKLVAARLYKSAVGVLWYRSKAVMDVVQGSGRGVRSKSDRCVTYVLDQQIVKLIADNPGFAPGWFLDACW